MAEKGWAEEKEFAREARKKIRRGRGHEVQKCDFQGKKFCRLLGGISGEKERSPRAEMGTSNRFQQNQASKTLSSPLAQQQGLGENCVLTISSLSLQVHSLFFH